MKIKIINTCYDANGDIESQVMKCGDENLAKDFIEIIMQQYPIYEDTSVLVSTDIREVNGVEQRKTEIQIIPEYWGDNYEI